MENSKGVQVFTGEIVGSGCVKDYVLLAAYQSLEKKLERAVELLGQAMPHIGGPGEYSANIVWHEMDAFLNNTPAAKEE